MKPGKSAVHWMVRMNHHNRSLFMLMALAFSAAHMHGGGWSWPAWAAILFLGLAYSHLLYAWARRARDQAQAEFANLLIDTFVAGLWAGVLGFPLWLSFALCFSCMTNLTVFRGPLGSVQALAAGCLGGALAVLAVPGWHFTPQTGPLATALSMGAVSVYLLVVANAAFQRALKLHQVQRRLRDGEQALSRANSDLEHRLAEIEVLQGRLQDQADRDGLTGLFNRRYMEQALERAVHDCEQQKQPLSLMVIDIDHFKQINDSHGHPAGDAVLRALATLLADHSRATDIVCRYGGEEFVVLLPGMALAVAHERAEQYCRRFRELMIYHAEACVSATLSIGVAANDPDDRQPRDGAALVSAADLALYRAKGAGRDRVEVAGRT